jgi:hypothetical protein
MLIDMRKIIAIGLLAISGAVHAHDSAGPGDFSQAVLEADAAVRAEMMKAVTAGNAVLGAIDQYHATLEVQRLAADLAYKATQPTTMDQLLSSQEAFADGEIAARKRTMLGQSRLSSVIKSNTNTYQYLDTQHRHSNDLYCTLVESLMSVCQLTKDSKLVGLAGADQDAMNLFQSTDGSITYEGEQNGIHVQAVDGYIQRVVVGIPPEQIPKSSKVIYAKSSHARDYVELQRRYKAFLSMSSYSLNRIKESRNPLK